MESEVNPRVVHVAVPTLRYPLMYLRTHIPYAGIAPVFVIDPDTGERVEAGTHGSFYFAACLN